MRRFKSNGRYWMIVKSQIRLERKMIYFTSIFVYIWEMARIAYDWCVLPKGHKWQFHAKMYPSEDALIYHVYKCKRCEQICGRVRNDPVNCLVWKVINA